MKIREDWRARLETAVGKQSRKGISLAAGLNETFLRDTLKKETVPSLTSAEKLSISLGIPIGEWFLELSPAQSLPDALADATHNVPAPREMPRDVPVRGIAEGGPDGTFFFDADATPIDYVRRPPRLRGISDAYALYVQGGSMSPWREGGSLVYVAPRLPVQNGDYVAVQLRSEEHAQAGLIKRLLKRTSLEVHLEQYNPIKTLIYPAEQIVVMHKIIDWSELLGI